MASTEAAIASILGKNVTATPSAIQFYESAAEGGYILRVAVELDEAHFHATKFPADRERRRAGHKQKSKHAGDAVWFGLRYEQSHLPTHLELLRTSKPGTVGDSDNWLNRSLIMGANMVWETSQLSRLLRDPTSQLPGRAEFQARLKEALHTARSEEQPLHLLLINPDEFGVINQHLDRESGDTALAEVAAILRGSMRHSDDIFRYGGAVFALLMPGADVESVESVSKKILRALTGAYLEGAVRLTFSAGGGPPTTPVR